ncbi:hypothetical protein GE09DRAFT_1069291 [Coniochaeta sp. 2T2.1]|nr:hypothetical protein GE09DRAFT_1069291 [Coniochaeta sp. 2T2.1]
MLRGTTPLLRLPARALLNKGKTPINTTSPKASFHRLSAPNGVLTQLRAALPQATITTTTWRAQYATTKGPYLNPDEIKKAEKEARDRKLEAHPESVTSTSTMANTQLPDAEPTEPKEGTTVTKEDKDEVLADLKKDINTVVETVALTAVPPSYYRLGLAGTMPYLFTSLSTVYLSWNLNTPWPTDNQLLNSFMVSNQTAQEFLAHLEPIQLGYGAVIISFLGAIHWGLELAEKTPLQPRTNFRFAMGVLAPALAWPTMLLPIEWALTGQFACFVGLYFADARATTLGWAPQWYGTYRWVLTAIVGGAIVVSLIGRFKVGHEGKALSTQGLRETMAQGTVGAEPYKKWEKKEEEEKKRIKAEKEKEEKKKEEAEKKLKGKEKGEGKGKKSEGKDKEKDGDDGEDGKEKKSEGKDKEKDGDDGEDGKEKKKEKKD